MKGHGIGADSIGRIHMSKRLWDKMQIVDFIFTSKDKAGKTQVVQIPTSGFLEFDETFVSFKGE